MLYLKRKLKKSLSLPLRQPLSCTLSVRGAGQTDLKASIKPPMSKFRLHGVNEHGKKVLSKKVSRASLPSLIANIPSCTIVMEACGSANYWSRKFMSYGHKVSQISPQHVKPFVQGNKNDKNDARAIVIASLQDGMPTVSIKTVEQQEIQMLHGYRDALVKDRTALANRMRGYLQEMGFFLEKGLSQVRKKFPYF